MAFMEKFYPLKPEIMKNVICDVAEMRKAKTTSSSVEIGDAVEVKMTTEMYKIKTVYTFGLTRDEAGTKLSIESGNGDENSIQNVEFMFIILDGMINPPKNRVE